MFDNNVFLDGSFKVEKGGFSLETNITYYRGIPLSMVNNIKVALDGEDIDRDAISCSVDAVDWFTLDEMKTVTTYKWEYGEPLFIKVKYDYEIEPGEHDVELTVIVRTAYIPVPLEGKKTRKIVVK